MKNDVSLIFLCFIASIFLLNTLQSFMKTSGAQEEGSNCKQEEDFHQEEGRSQDKDRH